MYYVIILHYSIKLVKLDPENGGYTWILNYTSILNYVKIVFQTVTVIVTHSSCNSLEITLELVFVEP